MSENQQNVIKVVLLGETGTGKTNLINVYFGFKFSSTTASSLTPESYQKELTIDKKQYIINIWDTAGQEQYRSMTKIFIKGAKIIIFVYDITMPNTFKELNYWVKNVEDLLGKGVIFGLVGNKIDLYDKQEVTQKQGEEYSTEIGALFCETSAKDDAKGFREFVKQLVEEYLVQNGDIKKEGEGGNINLNAKPKKEKCSC